MASNTRTAGTDRNDGSAYRATPSDPTAASNSDALRAIGRHVWRYAVLPGVFERCITETTTTTEEYARALFQIERRKIVHRLSPAHGYQKRHESPLPDPNAFDPWAIDDEELVKTTSCIARCPACEGTKKTVCSNCYGSGRVACGFCGGAGRVQGQKGPRNCPSCNGRGDARCDYCSRGRVDCVTCDTAGRVEAWLEIMRVPVSHVRGHPDGPGAQVHHRRADPADFDAGPAWWPHRLLSDTGVQPVSAAKVPPDLAPELDRRADRVISVRIQRFAAEVHRVAYELPTGRGALVLSGTPPRFAPTSDWRPLVRRRWALAAAAGAMAIASFWIYGAYIGRHMYFRAYGADRAIGWLAFGLWLAVMAATACLTVPRRAWRPLTSWAPLGVAAAVLLSVVGTYAGTGPSKHEAELALSASERHHAKVTAEALVELGIDPPAGRAILDELQYRDFLVLPSLRAKADAARKTWRVPENRKRAAEHVLEQARELVDKAAKSCDSSALDQIAEVIAPFDQAYKRSVASDAALCRVKRCTEQLDCACVEANLDGAEHAPENERKDARANAHEAFRKAFDEERAKDAAKDPIRVRATHLGRGKAHGECASRLGSAVDAAAFADVVRALGALEKAINVEDERLAREAEAKRKQEEARAKAEQARADAEQRRLAAIEERREATRRVICRDGTVSPSCLCSGSRRGCCSHHGGVRGCE